VNIDALCAAALARLSESTDARIEAFRQQSRDEYHQIMRSLGQKARRLREALVSELRRAA
jgi:hypothetical protein